MTVYTSRILFITWNLNILYFTRIDKNYYTKFFDVNEFRCSLFNIIISTEYTLGNFKYRPNTITTIDY